MNTVTRRNDGGYSFFVTHTTAFDLRGTSPAQHVRGRYNMDPFFTAHLVTHDADELEIPVGWRTPIRTELNRILSLRPIARGHTIDEDGNLV